MTNPLVSVVITTRNEEKHIENCILSVLAQSYKNVEILVIDNNSSDHTKEIAQRYTSLVFDKGPERSTQRNFGIIDKAHGKYAIFLDADMILSASVINTLVNKAEASPEVGAYYIPEIVLGRSFFCQCRRFERLFYDATVIDGVRFFLRQHFINIGGFDINLYGGEDWDFDKRMKTITLLGTLTATEGTPENSSDWLTRFGHYIDARGVDCLTYSSVIFHNESDSTLKLYLRKKAYYTGSMTTYIDKWGGDDPDIRKQFGFLYRFIQVFTENGKWKRLVKHPILTLGMYVIRILVGVTYAAHSQFSGAIPRHSSTTNISIDLQH